MAKNTSLSTESYKGVRDFYPEDMAIQNYIFNTWKRVVESFGYNEYSASVLEPAELYRAKSGEEIVNEQTYTFVDRGDREVTLRPEMTPTVARLVAGRKRDLGFPIRWYSIPNVFRYERPQRGRLREHWQLNVDAFGLPGPEIEIETITLAYQIMKAFGADDSDFGIKISSRKLLNAIFANWYELDELQGKALQKLIDKKNKMPEEVFTIEAEKIVGRKFTFLNLQKGSPDFDAAMAIPTIRSAKEELDEVIQALHLRGINNVAYDETLIRGFDYYTGTVFEVFDTNPENNRSLFGGGRYDELLQLFGGDTLPAFGFGMGDVTIRDFLETRSLLPKYQSSAQYMICIMSKNVKEYADEIASTLREEGKMVAVNYSYKSIGDQIKCAEKQGIQKVIVIGEDEKNTHTYTVKDITSKKYI